MNDEMKTQPALTPEEWAAWLASTPDFTVSNEDIGSWVDDNIDDHDWKSTEIRQRGALAAIALHPDSCLQGQPFGFTWEDVEVLRRLGEWNVEDHEYHCDPEAGRAMLGIADRIAALLPPREEVRAG